MQQSQEVLQRVTKNSAQRFLKQVLHPSWHVISETIFFPGKHRHW